MDRKTFWIILPLLVIGFVGFFMVLFFEVKSSEIMYTDGTVYDVAKEGLLFKTWEMRLTVTEHELKNTTIGLEDNTMRLSIPDQGMAGDLKKARNKKVRIFYRRVYLPEPWVRATPSRVEKFEIVK